MNLTNYERETIILYNQEESNATITTYDPRQITKLLNNKDVTILEKDVDGDRVIFVRAIFHKRLLTIREKRTERILTEEEKQEYRDRMNRNLGR